MLPLGTRPCEALLCFAFCSITCLNGDTHRRECGDETSCADEEPGQAGCPEGRLCPGPPPAPCPPGTFLSGVSPHHHTPFCHLCPRGFFNPWPSQGACFPCGSVATQPEEGKDTCICPGPGRVFQPSDAQCPCLPGHQDVGDPRGCVQREHRSCQDGAARNQEGLCLTRDQWNNHCAHEVCATPGEAHGYDPRLGVCLCWGQDSSGMCGPLCPEEQRHVLRLSCSEGVPLISIPSDTRSQELYLLDRPASPRAVGHPCNMDQRKPPVPLYVVQMDGTGFLGLTSPGRALLRALGLPLRDAGLPGRDVGTSREGALASPGSLSLNSTRLRHLLPPEPGIRNPTVCLQVNDTLAFLVTREHYPEYDLGHFYNTAGDFDWGRFRALAAPPPPRGQSPFVFLHQFQQPGVYVFRLSSNRHRKAYVRALPPGGQCAGEGPYTPTTPRSLIHIGIARIPRPPKSPEWPGVLGGLFLLLGLGLLLVIQCHSLNWARKAAPHPTFRDHQQAYNLDVYASARTGVTSVRRGRSHQDSDTPRVAGGHGVSWEAQEQVDLECFDTETFFGILLRQSLSVTAKLSQTKEELKLLCLKLVSEAHSLRQLWVAERGTPACTDQTLGSPQKEQQQAAEAAARAAEEEAGRRGRLAGEYAACLRRQLELLGRDLGARQGHWASFCSALAAAWRLLKAQARSRPGKASQAGPQPHGEAPQLDAALGRLSQALLQEAHRLKAWGVLGTGTGAELLRPASAGPAGDPDDVRVNPITKLRVPGPNCAMLPASGHAGPVPRGHFVHPDTGRVLPEAGNLGYDLEGATLVPTTDFGSGDVRTSAAAVLPYVPYPTCPSTGCPPATRLPVLQPQRTSPLGALMTDPSTGIEVPVLAVTLHPQTGQWLTLGGTYCNPLTKTLAPLELGSPVEDPATGGVAPILGVGLDENTGQVLALGGLRDASGHLLLPGDSFVEPLSGKAVRLQGASRREGRTLPHAGGPQALLDANVLGAQRRVTAALRRCQQRPASRAQGLLAAAVKDARRALALSLSHVLQQARRLEGQLEAARVIEASGGRLGAMCYPGTELWVPVLYGMEIPDPEGSGLMVPILGMESDEHTADTTPLAGSMEDAKGKGLVPISMGAQAVDPLTGEPGPVVGAQVDPCTGVVVPIVQVLEALPRGGRDPGLLDALEGELRAREQYWHHQELDEAWLAERLGDLSQELPSTAGGDAWPQLRTVEDACAALESRRLQETQRRARALRPHGGPERALLAQADREEWDQEAQVALGMRHVLQSLGRAAAKLRQAAGRLQRQEEEVWLQRERDQRPHVWTRPRKVVRRLSDELQVAARERLSFLDRALGQLQYQRELSRLQLSHTQIVASGTPVCLENYPGNRFYGTVTASLGEQAAACPLLIPFLKSLTAELARAQGHGQELEGQGPGTDAHKAGTMWNLPLFPILEKADIWSQAYKEEAELQGQMHPKPAPTSSWQGLPKPQEMQKQELIVVPPTELRAREFVVYQYGLSILQLLTPQLPAPEITLQIASHLPAVEENAFQSSFFYQSAENTLFVGRECLGSVGSFVLLLLHCLAHIAAGSFHQDSSPAFLSSFHKALKAYFRDAFSITLQMSAISRDGTLDGSLSAVLLEDQPVSPRGRDLLSKLVERRCEPRLEPKSSEEYIKKNKDLLLFTNMEHFLKSILATEPQIPRTPRDRLGGEDKLRCPYDLH